jgi:hypothetical protein
MTNTAANAAEYKSNIGHDFSMADALDPEYLDAAPTPQPAPKRRDERAPVKAAQRPVGQKVGAFLI